MGLLDNLAGMFSGGGDSKGNGLLESIIPEAEKLLKNSNLDEKLTQMFHEFVDAKGQKDEVHAQKEAETDAEKAAQLEEQHGSLEAVVKEKGIAFLSELKGHPEVSQEVVAKSEELIGHYQK